MKARIGPQGKLECLYSKKKRFYSWCNERFLTWFRGVLIMLLYELQGNQWRLIQLATNKKVIWFLIIVFTTDFCFDNFFRELEKSVTLVLSTKIEIITFCDIFFSLCAKEPLIMDEKLQPRASFPFNERQSHAASHSFIQTGIGRRV